MSNPHQIPLSEWQPVLPNGEGMVILVVYDHPTDYPHHYVLRPWIIMAGKVEAYAWPYLCEDDSFGGQISPAFSAAAPQPEDDPSIVRVYL